jgi:hypothetical protein
MPPPPEEDNSSPSVQAAASTSSKSTGGGSVSNKKASRQSSPATTKRPTSSTATDKKAALNKTAPARSNAGTAAVGSTLSSKGTENYGRGTESLGKTSDAVPPKKVGGWKEWKKLNNVNPVKDSGDADGGVQFVYKGVDGSITKAITPLVDKPAATRVEDTLSLAVPSGGDYAEPPPVYERLQQQQQQQRQQQQMQPRPPAVSR